MTTKEDKITVINAETGEETECTLEQFLRAISMMNEDYIKKQGW